MIFLLLVQVVSCSRSFSFESSDVSIYREIQGSGLKQDLYTKVSIPSSMSCELQELISSDFFIDIEELPKSPQFKFNSKIDIELPSSLSPSHHYSIIIPKSMEFTYPVHLRYNDCSHNSLYKELKLKGPVIKCVDNLITVPQELLFKVPVGNLEEASLVISVTMITVLGSVFWIVHTIYNLRKAL